MSANARSIDADGQLDELTFEPVQRPEGEAGVGLILDSLRRQQPELTIR